MQKKYLERQQYEFIYDDAVPGSQFYIDYFETMPSKRTIKGTFKTEVVSLFLDRGFDVLTVNDKDNANNKNGDVVISTPQGHALMVSDNQSRILLCNVEKKIFVSLAFSLIKENNYRGIIEILYDYQNGAIEKQLKMDFLDKHIKEESEFSIKLIRNDNGFIDTEEFDLEVPKLDLETNYGTEFVKKHDIILESLNKMNSKGIVLLHGQHGSGKTTYIKYLTSKIKGKNILFVPPSMADILSEPSIIPFLIDNANSILLIEDGEKVIGDRETSPSYASGVSNLLNMTDGILGDCLNIQVIVTFNMEKEKIDDALLRNGRLICEHEFGSLTTGESQKVLDLIGKDHKAVAPMTLADIYNVDSITYREKKQKSGLGFK